MPRVESQEPKADLPTTNDQRPTTISADPRPTAPIKFGTDGWRAVIADDFTFDNVRRVAGAIASYVLNHEDASHGVIVGYDTRFGSPRFARIAAEVLASAGIPVKLANDATPMAIKPHAAVSTCAATT